MAELTTEQLIKIIIGILVFVAVIVGVFLFFRFKVIDFFKGYTDEEPEGGMQGGTTGEGATKGYKIIEAGLGFEIGGITTLNREVVKTGEVKFIILSKDNCDAVGYQIWKEGPILNMGDNMVSEDDKISLERVDILLNALPKGKYHVDCFCYDNTKKERDHKTSKNLEIK